MDIEIGTDAWNDAVSLDHLVTELVESRKKQGLRQIDVAKVLGIGQPAVSEFESGATSPKVDTIQRYARAIGMELTFRLEQRNEHSEG